MASQWGLVQAPRGWYGTGIRIARYKNVLPPAPEPPSFSPTDVSGLAFWLDANDSDTVVTDASGFQVTSWAEKTKGLDIYYPVDGGNKPLYNTHFMNDLNVVYFPLNAALRDAEGTFDFNSRSVFIVCKPLAFDIGAIVPDLAIMDLIAGSATSDMTCALIYTESANTSRYAICSNGNVCGLNFVLTMNPLQTKMIVTFQQSGTNAAENKGFYDTVEQTLSLDNATAGYNPTGQYTLSSDSKQQSIDIAEILMYDSILSETDTAKVLDYLADKWSLQGVTPEGFSSESAPAPAPAPAPALAPVENTSIIYGAYIEGEYPNFYWCDDSGIVEIPYMLAADYDGTTAYRNGEPVTVTNVFYS